MYFLDMNLKEYQEREEMENFMLFWKRLLSVWSLYLLGSYKPLKKIHIILKRTLMQTVL
jgi:hypothetical protein